MIDQTLKKLGLKDKEIAVYLELMRLGRSTHAKIAMNIDVNRATVYSVVNILVKKGLIAEDLGGKIQYLNALPPKNLHTLIEQERRKITKKEDLVEQAVEELAELPLNTQYSVPHVRFLDEDQLELALHSDIEKWEKSMIKVGGDTTWWGFQDYTFAEHFEEWIEWYWKRAPKEMQLKLLSNESAIETELEGKELERRHIKLTDKPSQFTATTWVLGEYVLMIYTNERPFYAIEIYNPVLAHNHRELFKNIWNKF